MYQIHAVSIVLRYIFSRERVDFLGQKQTFLHLFFHLGILKMSDTSG
jgi:hypothetical protein